MLRATSTRRPAARPLHGRHGLVYPAVVTGIAQVTFPGKANGSLIESGRARPSARAHRPAVRGPEVFLAPPLGHLALSVQRQRVISGSNQGPTNPALADAVAARIKALRDADPGNRPPVPVDLVTASASGLDPRHQPRGGRIPGRSRRQSTRHGARQGSSAGRAGDRRAAARISRRAGRQRAGTQSCARCRE